MQSLNAFSKSTSMHYQNIEKILNLPIRLIINHNSVTLHKIAKYLRERIRLQISITTLHLKMTLTRFIKLSTILTSLTLSLTYTSMN